MVADISPVKGPSGSQWQSWAPSRTSRESIAARRGTSETNGGQMTTETAGDPEGKRSRKRAWTAPNSSSARLRSAYIFQSASTYFISISWCGRPV